MKAYHLTSDQTGRFYPSRVSSSQSKKISITSSTSGTIPIPEGASRCQINSSAGADIAFGWSAQSAATSSLTDANGWLHSGGTVSLELDNLFDGLLYYHSYNDVVFFINFYGA